MSKGKKTVGTVLALTAALVVISGLDLLAAGRESKTGFLIPSQCQPREGGSRPEGPYDEWPAPHTTECALAEGCIASGYGLWVMDAKAFYRLDEAGQARALEYFRTTKRTSYNKVAIIGDFSDAESVEIFEMKLTD